jgi:DNA end-binding protein Ku
MGPAAWKGIVRFGLLSVPLKLYRAAQAEKISFRQVHAATGARVRHHLHAEAPSTDLLEQASGALHTTAGLARETEAATYIPERDASLTRPEPVPVSRRDLTKGYEYERDAFVCVSADELKRLRPLTARETAIQHFVRPAEIDAVAVDVTFFAVPERGAERVYALLFEALSRTGLLAVAQITMHSRESIVVLRAAGCGIIAQSLFYEPEIRRERQYRANVSAIRPEELSLAVRLVEENLVPFDPMNYCDTYRESLLHLLRERTTDQRVLSLPATGDELIRALEQSVKASGKKPSAHSLQSRREPPQTRAAS